MSRGKLPKGTTLDVAVACLKAGKSDRNPSLIEEMEKIAREYKGRDRTLDLHSERKRIATQRAAFAELPAYGPEGASVDQLKQIMIDRAWKLLDIGQCDACDALLEFVPEADATKMLDEYFKEEGE